PNNAYAPGNGDAGLTGLGCTVGTGTAPCTAGVTAPLTKHGHAEMGTWPFVNRVNRFGSFKAAQLREVELTGPYFHNGGKLTLLHSSVHDSSSAAATQRPSQLPPLLRASCS